MNNLNHHLILYRTCFNYFYRKSKILENKLGLLMLHNGYQNLTE